MAPKRASTPWGPFVAERVADTKNTAKSMVDRSSASYSGAKAKAMPPWRQRNEKLEPQYELDALAKAEARALAFEPGRHQVYIEGRPVVAAL